MKKTGKRLKVILATSAALAIPMFVTPPVSFAQDSTTSVTRKKHIANIKWADALQKLGSDLTIAGMDGTQTVFKKTDGTMFTVDQKTGDLKTVSKNNTVKLTNANVSRSEIKGSVTQKGRDEISLVGVDSDSHLLMKNKQGDTFYLNQQGDMVFVK